MLLTVFSSGILGVEHIDMLLTVTRTITELQVRSTDVMLLEPPAEVGEIPLFLVQHPRTTANSMHRRLRKMLHELVPAYAELTNSFPQP